MNLITIFQRYPDQEACIEHLERVRWGDAPFCPHCGVTNVARKGDGHRVGRWNCHGCKSSFNVLSGTIFEKTKIPLQKWFLGIGLIVSAKKSLSSCQLARDLDLNQKSAWYMMQRVRAEMATKQGEYLLQGIVEAVLSRRLFDGEIPGLFRALMARISRADRSLPVGGGGSGCRAAVGASSRFAAPPLRSGPPPPRGQALRVTRRRPPD